jgi:hypothetical protein
MSCDKTSDVLSHMLLSFYKYWDENMFDVYVGVNENEIKFNKNNFKSIKSKKGNWKSESLEQINNLLQINPDLTHVILFLDDFILNKNVDSKSLNKLCNEIIFKKIKYLRLKKIEESLFFNFFNSFRKKILLSGISIFRIRRSHPYYSSLQVAIWDINHLIETIKNSENIWNFENLNFKNVNHFSVTNNIFNYKHVVEKGNWEFYAESFCTKYLGYFNKGSRKMNSDTFINVLKLLLKKVKFMFFGYIKTPFNKK